MSEDEIPAAEKKLFHNFNQIFKIVNEKNILCIVVEDAGQKIL